MKGKKEILLRWIKSQIEHDYEDGELKACNEIMKTFTKAELSFAQDIIIHFPERFSSVEDIIYQLLSSFIDVENGIKGLIEETDLDGPDLRNELGELDFTIRGREL